MMLQHRVHTLKQCNRSSLLSSSHLPPPCPSVRKAMNIQFPPKNCGELRCTPDSYSRCSPKIIIAICSSAGTWCACLHWSSIWKKHRGEEVILSLCTGHVLSPSPAACSWFSLSEGFGWAAAIITQLGTGKSRPVADACLIAAGCVRRLQDLL